MSQLEARRADAEARRLAQLRFDTPIVMEAGAGTGKTAVLVARVIAWSLGPGWERSEAALSGADADAVAARVLRRVVAITFTEAAAAEMAARAAEFLLLLERGEAPVGLSPEALPVGGEGECVRARARALLGVLDQLRVQSIHAWCRSLLASHPLEAGLHPRFEVDADGTARREVVREILERFLEERFDREVDPDVLALAEAGVGPSALGRALEELLEAGVPPAFLAADPFGPDAITALLVRTRGVIADFLAAEGGRLADVARLPATLMSRLAETGEAVDALCADQEGLEALIDIAGDWPKNLIDRLAKWRSGGFGKAESEALGDGQDALAEAAGALRALLLHLGALDPTRLERGMRVLHPLLAEAGEALRRRGAAGFHKLLSGTRDLLRDHPAVAAAERAGIDQLLVDEFQDTDRLQCDIVVALALTGPPAQRPGLFIVGDPKQSIYGWRNADLRAYDAFLHGALPDAERRRLSVNYRSSGALLAEVERAVSPVMEEQAGVQPRFEPLLAHEPEAAAPGAEAAADPPVEYWVSWPLGEDGLPSPRPRSRDATALEARAVAADLARRQANGRLAFADVALLMRSQGDLDRYLEALRAAGVPYTVDGERSYYRRREVVDASALVRSILDPNDLLALVTYLRSPWVGVPDAAWVPLFARGLPDIARSLFGEPGPVMDEIAALVESAAKVLPTEVPGLAELAGWGDSLVDALDGLARLRECFATEPADTFVETLRAGLLIEASEAARYLGAHRVAGLDRFFRELLVALEAGGGDAPRVLRGLREAIAREPDPFAGPPRDPGEDAVRVMTIHRAKGLDFGEVYLLQHHKGARHGEAPDREVVLPSDLAEGEFKLFGACTLGFDRVLAAETAREQAELVRTLYVAMTRAKRRLVVAGAWGEPVHGPRQAGSHQQLLACRLPSALLGEQRVALAGAGRSHFDDAGARFVFPALVEAGAAAPAAHPSGRGAASDEELASAARDLAALRVTAEARQGLRLARPASEDAPAEEREQLAEERFAPESPMPLRFAGRSRERATVVGSAVHRALELLDPAGLLLLERPRCDEAMQQVVGAALPPALVDEALAEAHALLDHFLDGPLYRRFCAIGSGIVARELPVLLAADDAPGYVVGAVDLVYRDPADGAWVVADWKTDAVPRGGRALASRYRAQLRRYLRAVQGALDLPEQPRGELWFLAAGRVL